MAGLRGRTPCLYDHFPRYAWSPSFLPISADDFPTRHPPPLSRPSEVAEQCCVGPPNWSGIYFGGQFGGAFSQSQWGFPFVESFNTGPNQGFSAPASGALWGGHLGVDYHFHEHFLIGAEVAYFANSMVGRTTGPLAVFPNDRFDIREIDLFTVAGRLGIVYGQYLFYGRAGYASAAAETTGTSPLTGITGQASH